MSEPKRTRGRPPVISSQGDGIVATTVKLFRHQVAWLNSRTNGNATLRELVEKAMGRTGK